MSKYINLRNFIQDEYKTTFILGARGTGKTINAFKMMIEDFKNTGERGIYMRRFITEIEKTAINLDLLKELTDTKDLTRDFIEVDGSKMDMLLVDGEPAIYMLALRQASKFKSNSFQNVKTLIYDEFLDLDNRELRNETFLFYQFCMTVFRDFKKYNAVFLANATNLFNCYFLDLEVFPKGKITKFKEESIKIVMYQTSEELEKEQNNTALGKIVEKIEGEDGSSLHNKFNGNYTDFISNLSKNAKYKMTIKLNNSFFGLYKDGKIEVISKKFDDNFKTKFALSYEDVDEDFALVDWDIYTALRYRFLKTKVFFSDVKTRSLFIKKFKKNSLYL